MSEIKEFREFFLRDVVDNSSSKKDQEVGYPTTHIVDGVSRGNRFLASHYPSDNVFAKFFESICFKLNQEDSATNIQAGLVKLGILDNVITGTKVDALGFPLVATPDMIPSLYGVNSLPIAFSSVVKASDILFIKDYTNGDFGKFYICVSAGSAAPVVPPVFSLLFDIKVGKGTFTYNHNIDSGFNVNENIDQLDINIGSKTYTEQNVVTSGDVITKSIDDLDKRSKNIPVKVYKAIISQTGINHPVVTVIHNTIGNIVWTRDSEGVYLGTLAGAFTLNTTFVSSSNRNVMNNKSSIFLEPTSVDVITLNSVITDDLGVVTPTDGLISSSYISIEVY